MNTVMNFKFSNLSGETIKCSKAVLLGVSPSLVSTLLHSEGFSFLILPLHLPSGLCFR